MARKKVGPKNEAPERVEEGAPQTKDARETASSLTQGKAKGAPGAEEEKAVSEIAVDGEQAEAAAASLSLRAMPSPAEGMEAAVDGPAAAGLAVQEQQPRSRPNTPAEVCDLQQRPPAQKIEATEEPPLAVEATGIPAPSSEPHLASSSLEDRILAALASDQTDNAWLDKDEIMRAVDAPVLAFNKALNALREAKKLRTNEVDKRTLLYLPLSEQERKDYREYLAALKKETEFDILVAIHDRKLYREGLKDGGVHIPPYSSWEKFLWHERGHVLTWWQSEMRRVRIQRLLAERGIVFQVPLKKNHTDQLNRLEPEAMVAAVAEWQAIPEKQRIAKRLREIVDRIKAVQQELAYLRQFVPDVTAEEARWLSEATGLPKGIWRPELTGLVEQRAKESGRPTPEVLLDVIKEDATVGLCPRPQLLQWARGKDLAVLVRKLEEAARWREERADVLKRSARLGIPFHDANASASAPTPPASTGLLVVQGGQVVTAASVHSPASPPAPSDDDDDNLEDSDLEKEEEEDFAPAYPDGIDLDNNLIVWAEGHDGEPFDLPYLLDIARDAVLIAAHRAKTNNEWDTGVLGDLAVAILDALEPFLKEPAAEAEEDEAPPEQT
jgi:hypothetical protein